MKQAVFNLIEIEIEYKIQWGGGSFEVFYFELFFDSHWDTDNVSKEFLFAEKVYYRLLEWWKTLFETSL